MKTILLFFTVIVLCINSSAQLKKGGMMLGGNFNYSKNHSTDKDTSMYSSNPTNDNKTLGVNINYGYFITDKIAVGVYGSYYQSTFDSKSTQFNGYGYISNTLSSTSKNFGGGIFSRYYQMIGKSKFAVFGQLAAGYNAGKQEQKQVSLYYGIPTAFNSHSELSEISVGFRPGLVYFFNKHIAIETSFGNMGYSTLLSKNHTQNGSYSERRNSSFNTNLNLSLSNLYWGVNFYFGGKKSIPTQTEK